MLRINLALILTILLAVGGSGHAQTQAAFRVLFGVNDSASTRWDGSRKVVQAGQYTLEPWRFESTDNIDGNLFHFTTRADLYLNSSPNGSPNANGFVVAATTVTDNSEFHFSTAQGDFSFRASEVAYGKGIYKLGGESMSTTADPPGLKIKLCGTSKFAKVSIIRDGNYVYSTSSNAADVEFSWRDNQPQKDKTSYYYVRGEPDDGEIVWVSPMWIKYTP